MSQQHAFDASEHDSYPCFPSIEIEKFLPSTVAAISDFMDWFMLLITKCGRGTAAVCLGLWIAPTAMVSRGFACCFGRAP